MVFGKRRSLLVKVQDGSGVTTLRFFHFSAAQKNALQTGARITRIETSHGRATRLHGEVDDEPLVVEAGVVVLAAGAANSAAILLGSRDEEHPTGIANSSGLVGRNYMVHNNTHLACIDPRRRNEAQRFHILIDALYENNVKLIAAADAPPEDLYVAGDGAFEFQRTVSRLMEMQSPEYLALDHIA